jgi:hypothetical protein
MFRVPTLALLLIPLTPADITTLIRTLLPKNASVASTTPSGTVPIQGSRSCQSTCKASIRSWMCLIVTPLTATIWELRPNLAGWDLRSSSKLPSPSSLTSPSGRSSRTRSPLCA